MDSDRKAAWTCIKCRQNISQQNIPQQNISKQNISQQKTTSTPTVTRKSIGTALTSNEITKVPTDKNEECKTARQWLRRKKVSTASTSTPKNTTECVVERSTYSSTEDAVAAPTDAVCSPVQRHCNGSSDDVTVINYNIPLRNSFDTLSHEESLDSLHDDTLNGSCPDLSGGQLDAAKEREGHSLPGEVSAHSLPNLNSQVHNIVVEELKEEVRVLKEQLRGADNEIQILLGETYALRDELSEIRKKCDLYKELLKATAPGSPFRTPVPKTKTNIAKRVMHTAKQTDSGCSSGPDSKISDSKLIKLKPIETNNAHSSKEQPANSDSVNMLVKNKLLILSSNKTNKISRLITDNDYFPNFSFCHHVKPGAGVKYLLQDIQSQLRHMTKNDYCVVLIGEEDFKSSIDLEALVQHIRVSVESITFTNLILACPTFVRGKQLYNARVDRFNQLLFNDLYNHNECFYAYDCNSNLSSEMFSVWSGRLKNSGMKSIIENLEYNICCYLNGNSVKFFRV